MEQKTKTYEAGKKLVDGIAFIGEKISEGVSNTLEKNLINEINSAGKSIGKCAKYIKKEPLCFIYPVLGNLSGSIQERIEDSTNDKYNSKKAVLGSSIFNGIGYAAYGCSLAYEEIVRIQGIGSYNLMDYATIIMLSSLEMLGGILEGIMRNETNSKASLVGKIVSLPIEGVMGVYDGIKERWKGNE